ncbi:hypothetical protein MIC448_1620004 [Microbacterium sp. C448]|nr:hypothetical protein MIC448_1620004 [Microbacterium sp. C448]
MGVRSRAPCDVPRARSGSPLRAYRSDTGSERHISGTGLQTGLPHGIPPPHVTVIWRVGGST